MDVERLMDGIGPRLRSLRQDREVTLAELSCTTGISVSTLSRLESGGRRPTLELLLTLAQAYRLTLDQLVDTPSAEDPRVRPRATRRGATTMVPLSVRPGEAQVYKMVFHVRKTPEVPRLRTHEGQEWLYVLRGRLRLCLGDQDLTLVAGEAAEFDTRVPHWFGRADGEEVEVLSLFGTQGVRTHVRARHA